MLEDIPRFAGSVIRFLVVEIITHWSPARIFRVFVLGHDPEDTDDGFGRVALWYLLDVVSWAALGLLVLWLFFM